MVRKIEQGKRLIATENLSDIRLTAAPDGKVG